MLSNIRLWCLTCPLIHIFGLIQKEMSVIQMRSENNSLDDRTKQNENNNNNDNNNENNTNNKLASYARTHTCMELIPLHRIALCGMTIEMNHLQFEANWTYVCWAIHLNSSYCRYASLHYRCDGNCNLWFFFVLNFICHSFTHFLCLVLSHVERLLSISL